MRFATCAISAALGSVVATGAAGQSAPMPGLQNTSGEVCCQSVSMDAPIDTFELVINVMSAAGATVFLVLERKAVPIVRAAHYMTVTAEALALLKTLAGGSQIVKLCSVPNSLLGPRAGIPPGAGKLDTLGLPETGKMKSIAEGLMEGRNSGSLTNQLLDSVAPPFPSPGAMPTDRSKPR
jgi:hypothetical protein